MYARYNNVLMMKIVSQDRSSGRPSHPAKGTILVFYSPVESCVRHRANPARRISPRSRRRPDQGRQDAVSSADAPTPIGRTAAARSIVGHLRDRHDTSERCESHGPRDPLSPTRSHRRIRAAPLFEGPCCPRRASVPRGCSPRIFSRAGIFAASGRRPLS